MTMNGPRTTRPASGTSHRPGMTTSMPHRPAGPERSPSNYSGSSRAQRPSSHSPMPNIHNSKDSYFPNDVVDKEMEEEPGPPELSETSVGAIIRLCHRFHELRECVGLWTDFRQGVPKCEESEWVSGYYIADISRSFNLVRRAYLEVQQLRSFGFGTEHPTTLENEIALVLNKIEDWRNKNIKNPRAEGASRRRANGNDGTPSPTTSSSASSSMVLARSDGANGQQKSASGSNSKNPSPSPHRPDSSHQAVSHPMKEPSREEVSTYIRRMINYMECIVSAVHACKLSRDQMDNGVRKMRKELLELQKESVEEMKRDSEKNRAARAGGNTQMVRRN